MKGFVKRRAGRNATQIPKMPSMLFETSVTVSFSIMPASRTHTGSKSPQARSPLYFASEKQGCHTILRSVVNNHK